MGKLIIFWVFIGDFLLEATPVIPWVATIGGGSNQFCRGLAVDPAGNSFVTGYFLGDALVGATTLTNRGLEDVFVARFDRCGQLSWVRHGGGISYDQPYAIATDNDGNGYVVGNFTYQARFDTALLTNAGQDYFIVKYDPEGNVLWALNHRRNPAPTIHAIAVDRKGNMFIAGSFSFTIQLGDFELVPTATGPDTFVAKLDSVGNVLWARSGQGVNSDEPASIAIDSAGNSYIVGNTGGYVSFDGFLVESGGVFMAKFDPDGRAIWAKLVVAPIHWSQGRGIALDAAANIYVTGTLSGFGWFDNFQAGGGGGSEFFLAKYNTLGRVIWVRWAGEIFPDHGFDVAVDTYGNSYMAGHFFRFAYFGSTYVTNYSAETACIAKYDSVGDLQWVQHSAARTHSRAVSVDADSFGNVYLAGEFTGTNSLARHQMVSSGDTDIFLASVEQFAPPLHAATERNQVTISWLGDCVLYDLETTCCLGTSETWTTVSRDLIWHDPPYYRFSASSADHKGFFRLRSQTGARDFKP